jgi:hypothetical protein
LVNVTDALPEGVTKPLLLADDRPWVIFDRPHRGGKPSHVGYAPFATELVRHCIMS